jgi:FdhE protein
MIGATTPRTASVREFPELQSWVTLCEDVRRALDDPPWGSVTRGPAFLDSSILPGAPSLADAVLAVDVERAARWLRHLFARAAAAGGPGATLRPERLSGEQAVALLGAAVVEDGARIQALARDLGAEPGALGAVAGLGAVPLLHAARRTVEGEIPAAWPHGYCPVCGAWPTLAEARGVERSRHFRCARCGCGWFAGWLRCPYCDNGDHLRLAALVSDDAGARHRVETCEVCRGYVKTVTVLLPTEPGDLALIDLDTLSLDLAAVAHGYHRPPSPGRMVSARVAPAPPPS